MFGIKVNSPLILQAFFQETVSDVVVFCSKHLSTYSLQPKILLNQRCLLQGVLKQLHQKFGKYQEKAFVAESLLVKSQEYCVQPANGLKPLPQILFWKFSERKKCSNISKIRKKPLQNCPFFSNVTGQLYRIFYSTKTNIIDKDQYNVGMKQILRSECHFISEPTSEVIVTAIWLPHSKLSGYSLLHPL